MGATKFRNRLKSVCPQIHVSNTSVDNIPADCDIAVVQTILADQGREIRTAGRSLLRLETSWQILHWMSCIYN